MSDIGGDVFDVRDVIERFEELEVTCEANPNAKEDDPDMEEFLLLRSFLEEIRGCGGDHQWRGDWYPSTFIRDSYFETYAQELADDLHGKEVGNAEWPFDCIDWEKAADQLKMDYSTVDFDGSEYLHR